MIHPYLGIRLFVRASPFDRHRAQAFVKHQIQRAERSEREQCGAIAVCGWLDGNVGWQRFRNPKYQAITSKLSLEQCQHESFPSLTTAFGNDPHIPTIDPTQTLFPHDGGKSINVSAIPKGRRECGLRLQALWAKAWRIRNDKIMKSA